MHKISLNTLLTLAVLFSGIAAILPLAWSGGKILNLSYHDSVVRGLTSNAQLIAQMLELPYVSQTSADLQKMLISAQNLTGNRYTIILGNGTVQADSQEDASQMENHRNRAEIQAALRGEIGQELRSSQTLGTDWIYVAIQLADGRVIRVADALDELNSRTTWWWKQAIFSCGLSLLILLLLAYLVAAKISSPLKIAAKIATRYAAGDFSQHLPDSGCKEIGILSESMHSMAKELNSRFKQIRTQKGQMQTIFTNMDEGVIAVDNDHKIILINKAAQDMFQANEAIYSSGIETLRNSHLIQIIQDINDSDLLETEIILDKSGTETVLQVHGTILSQNQQKIGILLILRDITLLRRLENMRRDFVANVSHELRTPVTTIQSCLETLLEEKVASNSTSEQNLIAYEFTANKDISQNINQKISDRLTTTSRVTADYLDSTSAESAHPQDQETTFLQMALRNTRRIGRIISNLLFLAGMESGAKKDHVMQTVTGLKQLLDEAVTFCAEDAAARQMRITIDCPQHLSVRTNPQLIVHALVNLLDNAIKYGPKGGEIAVNVQKDEHYVSIIVSDQGPGIARQYQERIFERFYRIDGATRLKKGSGLGLAIVKHIALQQGGDIVLESDIGQGSRFIIRLPVD